MFYSYLCSQDWEFSLLTGLFTFLVYIGQDTLHEDLFLHAGSRLTVVLAWGEG